MSNNTVITSAMYEELIDDAYLLPNLPSEIAERLDVLQRTVQRTVTSIITHLERTSEEEVYADVEFLTVMIEEYNMLLRDTTYIPHKIKQHVIPHRGIVLFDDDIEIMCHEVKQKVCNILRLIPEMLPSDNENVSEEE